MNESQIDRNQIDESLHDLGRLALLADAIRAGLEGAREKYELALSHRMEELERIASDVEDALARTDMSVEDYRRLCRGVRDRVARLRGLSRVP